MSSREFARWKAFDRLEPIGEQRADIRAALIAQTVANALGAGKKPFKLSDFLLQFEADDEESRSARLLDKVRGINRIFGGREAQPPAE